MDCNKERDVMVVGEYELVLNENPNFKFISYKKGKRVNNLLGSELAITLFNEIKSLREKNQELESEVKKLNQPNSLLTDVIQD